MTAPERRTVPARRRQRRDERPVLDQAAGRPHRRSASRRWRPRARPRRSTVSVIELREIATEISTALVSQLITPGLQQAIAALAGADGIIAATPVYKAGPSGLFTSFFHVLDNDLLIAKPVVLAATAGTARHALVADDQMRPLFAYLRALTVPTSLFAAPEDWGDAALSQRVDRAALELVLLMESGFARKVRDESWQQLPARVRQRAAAPRPRSTSTPT